MWTFSSAMYSFFEYNVFEQLGDIFDNLLKIVIVKKALKCKNMDKCKAYEKRYKVSWAKVSQKKGGGSEKTEFL